MKGIKIFILLFTFAFIFACSQSKDDVIIKAGSSKLTKQDLQEDLKSFPPQTKAFLSSPEGLNRLKDELIKREVLYEEAKKKGLTKSEDFKKRMEEFKKITLINMLLEQELKAVQQDVTEQGSKRIL